MGFDTKAQRIAELKTAHNCTGEIGAQDLATAGILFTDDVADLHHSDFFVVAVPTPVSAGNKPDLGPLLATSRSVATALKPGTVVVYESTVYPGATEEDSPMPPR